MSISEAQSLNSIYSVLHFVEFGAGLLPLSDSIYTRPNFKGRLLEVINKMLDFKMRVQPGYSSHVSACSSIFTVKNYFLFTSNGHFDSVVRLCFSLQRRSRCCMKVKIHLISIFKVLLTEVSLSVGQRWR